MLRLLFTWPWPVQPGVGHFSTFSCMAKTVRKPEKTDSDDLAWGEDNPKKVQEP